MKEKKIQDWSFLYFFYKPYVKLWFWLFYKEIHVETIENVTSHDYRILAPNHQNALMDALAILTTIPFQPVFMARADIFKGKTVKNLLRFLKIMPVFRLRDGIKNLSKNDEMFDKALDVIMSKKPLCLMPEGNHGEKRRLRPLVKGMVRIALTAQEQFKDKAGVKIIPVGIDYSHYWNFKTSLLIIYGQPIEISDYFNAYLKEPARTYNELKDRLAVEMRKIMLDIQNEDYYDSFFFLTRFYNGETRKLLHVKEDSLLNKFKASQHIAQLLDKAAIENPEKIKTLHDSTEAYNNLLKKLKLRNWILDREKYSYGCLFIQSLLMILLFPIFLFGFIHSIIPYIITSKSVRIFNDKQFHSSGKYAVGLILFLIFFLIFFFVAWGISGSFLLSFAYLISLYITGNFAFWYYIQRRKLFARWRYTVSNNSDRIKRAKSLRTDIQNRMHDIIK